MKRSLHHIVFALAAFGLVAGITHGATVTWDTTTGTWDTTSNNWVGGSPDANKYVDGGVDDAIFNNTSGGTVTIQGGGVTPLSTEVSAASGTYTFDGGDLDGTGGLTKSGAGILSVGSTYTGLVYTGNTQIDGGILQIDHDSPGTGISDRSLGGTLVLSGGTLRFNNTGGNANLTLNFTSGITVDADGGTIDFAGAANNLTNTLSAPTLGGDLIVTGVTGSPNYNGSPYNFTDGTLTLTSDAKITNNTTKPPYDPHDIVLSPTMSGSDHTLTLAKAGTGGGFQINNATANSMNLGGLVVDDGASLSVSAGNGVNPLSQIDANGGSLTIGNGSTLSFQATSSGSGAILDPTAIVWEGNGTLSLPNTGVNSNSYWRISNGDLVVSSVSGLTQLNNERARGTLTIDSPYALKIGDGGTFNLTLTDNTVSGATNGNLTLLPGAVVNATVDQFGGLTRDTSGTLTLGDGTGTTENPGVVTVQGQMGTSTTAFVLGYADNKTESGTVRMKYANTDADNYFNVGWCGSGLISRYASQVTMHQLPETSGGTEFAPLVGSGGVAVVGPTSGTVATFSNAVTLSTAGTVAFYNATFGGWANDPRRDSLGSIVIASGGSFVTQDVDGSAGTVQAASIDVLAGGILAGHGTFDVTDTGLDAIDIYGTVSPGTSGGTLTFDGNTTFESGGRLVIELGGTTDDMLDVNGTLTLFSGSVLEIQGSPTLLQPYVIGTYEGTLGGLGYFDQVIFSGGNYSVSYEGNQILFTSVPEPASAVLLGLAGLVLLRRRWRW